MKKQHQGRAFTRKQRSRVILLSILLTLLLPVFNARAMGRLPPINRKRSSERVHTQGIFPQDHATLFISKPAFRVSSPRSTIFPLNRDLEHVLYQADWSKGDDGWTKSERWNVLDGQLLNDGRDTSSIVAPYEPNHLDYAVEARIQIIRVHNAATIWGGCSRIGIFARAGTDNLGYQGKLECVALDAPYAGTAQIATDDFLAQTDYTPGSDWHTYRLEIRGNDVSFLMDGARLLETRSNAFLSPGHVGILCDHVEVAISRFSVTTL